MANIQVDTERKFIEVDLTGFVKPEEAVRISNELKHALVQFAPQDAVLLIDLGGFAPMSNDVPPILRGMGRDVVGAFRKAALIQQFSLVYQGRKLIEPPPGVKLPSFPTREAALEYLFQE